ncbi:hypothetical protein PENNAL_c0010G09750 [Penicillium nalgiovense]|uniref:Uncharacterized protein n=1 Tax=Penicillium nalgiovense TaxID=60175 RepID=A0A1V6YUX8_PENNA|nr:hypothetical protein PENNAL_c0010G09750 [Penicillium nalgiovense]
MVFSRLLPFQGRREKSKAHPGAEEGRKDSTNNTAAAIAGKEAPKKTNPSTPPPIANVSSNTEVGTGAQKPGNAPEEKGSSDLSISQILWNRAYDELAKDKETSDLVENYMRIIPRVTDPDGDVNEGVGDDVLSDMDDPIRRQAILKDAIKAGQARIAKGVIDLAVKANPQAALPWAGVCIGLQFLLNSAQASESQRNGIAYVITRMAWYSSLTEHLLGQENIDLKGQSYQAVVNELEGRFLALYKELLLYQMKSVCSYYKNRGLVILRSTINLDDWDSEMQRIKNAEKAVQNDSDNYCTVYSKGALGALVQQGQKEQKILVIGIISEISRQSFNLAPRPAYFFFQASQKSMTSPTDALRSLIWMLLIQQPRLFSYIRDTLRNAGASYFDSPSVFWPLAEIFKQMLADKDLAPVYLTLDALDECDEGNSRDPGRPHLLSLISDTLRITNKVKWLLSSRPEVDVYKKLKTKPAFGAIVELDVQSRPEPVNAYIEHKLSDLERDHEYPKDVLDEMSQEIRRQLHVASGLPANVRPALIVPKCGSFLTVQDNRVYMIHASAKEHLEDYFKFSPPGSGNCHHDDIGKRSIQAMSDTLKRNMYNITPDTTDVIVPEEDPLASVRYSCEFWVDHLCEDRGDKPFDDEGAFSFLKVHFLHWLESLSLIQKFPTAVSSIKKLLVNSKDGERFALRNSQVMRQAPLQTYGSALAFSPSKSEVKSRYWKERLPFIRNVQGGRDTWDPCLQTFTADYGLKSILFSPDGKFLASASKLCERVLLWDVATGISHTLKTTKHRYVTLAFSLDSKVLASSVGNKVELWDVATGTRMKSFEVFSTVQSMQYSPDGKVLVLAAETVQCWDIATQSCIQTLDGHTVGLEYVAFAPGGRILASASYDMTVKLWDFETSSYKLTIDLPASPRDITFSPDGNLLAASTADGCIYIFDAATGNETQILGEDIPFGGNIEFLADGKIIATCKDGQLRFLDVASGTPGLTLNHGEQICTLSVSQNIVASASTGGIVRLWDTTENWGRFLGGHGKSVSVMAFSSDGESLAVGFDGKTLASGSQDGTVLLWDSATGAPIQTLIQDKVISVTFSPDGTMLGVGTTFPTVIVWDVVTGTRRRELDVRTSPGGLAFSHDNKVILTISREGMREEMLSNMLNYIEVMSLKIWDIATGALKMTIKHSTGLPCVSVAISPDGKTVALCESDEWIQTWDASTGDEQRSIKSNVVNQNLSFSDDGRYLNTNEGLRRCIVARGRMWFVMVLVPEDA